MPLILFSFVFNTDTKEAAFSGNIEIQSALSVLQQLAIADAVSKAQEKPKEKKDVLPVQKEG